MWHRYIHSYSKKKPTQIKACYFSYAPLCMYPIHYSSTWSATTAPAATWWAAVSTTEEPLDPSAPEELKMDCVFNNGVTMLDRKNGIIKVPEIWTQ